MSDRGAAKPGLWRLLRPFFSVSPQPWHGIRRAILTACGAQLAATTKVRPSAKIERPWLLRTGHLTIIGDHAALIGDQPIHIGDRCVVSQHAVLATRVIDPAQPPGPPDPRRALAGAITIEDDCWIAADTLVLPGSTVRAGTVVGARGTVDGELPGWSIAVGAPARAIKPRAFVQPGSA